MNEKNRNALVRFLITLLIVLMIFVLFIGLYFLMFINKSNNEISTNGKGLFGNFKSYQGKIYVYTDDNEYLLLEGADLDSFQPASDYHSPSVAKDRKNVYCGNRVVEGLSTDKVRGLGNNYFTDGNNTFYLSPISEKARNISFFREVFELINNEFTGDEISQRYEYEIRKLEKSVGEYNTILDGLVATNGEKSYHLGRLMPNADSDKLRRINHISEGEASLSYNYFTDGRNVYFGSKLMDLKFNEKIISLDSIARANQYYLFNPLDGTVYLDDKLIASENAPYEIISTFDSHINQLLLLSESGVYFYNTTEGELQLVGENPFLASDYKEIAPFIFSDGESLLYVDAYDKKSMRKRFSHTGKFDYMATTINSLDSIKIEGNFSKLADVFYGSSVWKNGDDYYYFDNVGDSYLVDLEDFFDQESHDRLKEIIVPIYKIKDEITLNKILNKDDTLVGEFVRGLIDDGNIIPMHGRELLEAKTYHNLKMLKVKIWIKRLFLVFIVLAFSFFVIMLIIRNRTKNEYDRAIYEYEKIRGLVDKGDMQEIRKKLDEINRKNR